MKAATIGPEFGNDHLKIVERDMPSIGNEDVLIHVEKGGLNPTIGAEMFSICYALIAGAVKHSVVYYDLVPLVY